MKTEISSIITDSLNTLPPQKGRLDVLRLALAALRRKGILTSITGSSVASEGAESIYSIIGSVDFEAASEIRETVNDIFLSYRVKGSSSPLGETAIEKKTRELKELLEEEARKEAGSGVSSDEIARMDEEISNLKTAKASSSDRISVLESSLKALESTPTVRARTRILAGSSSNPILAGLLKDYSIGSPCIKTMLLAPPSFGKSHSVNLLGELYDEYLTHSCTKSMDEDSNILGGPLPDSEAGGFITVDGVVVQAMRAARDGKNVLLFLDEILRWKDKQAETLLAFLQPLKRGGDSFYSIRTRGVKDGKLEVIEAPVQNLHIVAAANLGMEIPSEALWSRFQKTRIPYTAVGCEEVALAIASSFHIDKAPMLAERYQLAMTRSRDLRHANRLEFPMDFRLLEVACEFKSDGCAETALEYIKSKLEDSLCQWDERSGELITDSVDAVSELKGLLNV